MKLTDPFEIIKAMPPGSAVYGRAAETPGKLETCFLIREDQGQIGKISKNPIIELRSGLWGGRVCLVVVMIKLAGLPYETWWNYHQEGEGEKYFDDMIRQTMLPILVFDNREKRRSIIVRNSLAKSFQAYREVILTKPPWSMSDFDQARESVAYSKYPTVQALWDALGGEQD